VIRGGISLLLVVSSFTLARPIGIAQLPDKAKAGSVHVEVEREVYLMGTRARLVVHDASRAAGLATLDAALAVLETTDAELSTWRDDSAISRLNRSIVGTPWMAEPPLCAMFGEVYRWSAATASAFDPAIGALAVAWGIHHGGRIPSSDDIQVALTRSGLEQITFDPAGCTLTRTTDVTIDVGAFGKGEALDRVAAALGRVSWMIDLGGQLSVGGSRPGSDPWTIDIAHPVNRERRFLQVRMRHGSLSTSGGSERDQAVDGQRVGHILDPRTGRPAPFRGSVTVWHDRGLIADILSTALYVMGPDEGTAWAEARGLSALYLIPDGAEVRVRATTAFERRLHIH
jgi:thiamine biosynthesis lipoprotein